MYTFIHVLYKLISCLLSLITTGFSYDLLLSGIMATKTESVEGKFNTGTY